MQLLHIDSAITGSHSVSRQLTAQIVAAWIRPATPAPRCSYLDLVADAPAHFTMDAMAPRTGQTEGLSEVQQRENAVSERLVSQFLAADVVVIGAPFYNFSIPTQLKAWIDRIAQPGRTFQYTANGPEGLAKGKTVIIAPPPAAACIPPAIGGQCHGTPGKLPADRAGLLWRDRCALCARRGRGHGRRSQSQRTERSAAAHRPSRQPAAGTASRLR
jgi:FMN-dependent NADH-azoreductase